MLRRLASAKLTTPATLIHVTALPASSPMGSPSTIPRMISEMAFMNACVMPAQLDVSTADRT